MYCMLTRHCGCFYIGKTKQEFHKRAYRHILSRKSSNPDLPLGRHVRDVHVGILPQTKFLILDRIHPNGRGGDWNRLLLQCETRWIVCLEATSPPGLNNIASCRLFLEGFLFGVVLSSPMLTLSSAWALLLKFIIIKKKEIFFAYL